ncbi:F-box/FBD/LRR-repeat protein [Trifolium medium]|uniref:F-box/FBD/LRR-repeat protein n=1 Tax=Trifolium medium TaxID=97028 RepID=A0A392MSW5_9FABA|nr:F-box/FBD/LRR-repeat protein [Trifolium medium]
MCSRIKDKTGFISNNCTSHQDMRNSNTSGNQFLIRHNLTNMELILKDNHSQKWNWLLEVLKHCPKLQNLSIHEDSYGGNGLVDNWMNPPIVPECLSTQLKTCLLNVYTFMECGVQFAKYIMQNSKVLNTMSVKTGFFIDITAKHDMIKKLALSRRPQQHVNSYLIDDS